jgi:3-mercaptopyruvate sulfurtransferase SseA
VRAALFACLYEVRTGQPVPVYDGSLMEWALESELPMETG